MVLLDTLAVEKEEKRLKKNIQKEKDQKKENKRAGEKEMLLRGKALKQMTRIFKKSTKVSQMPMLQMTYEEHVVFNKFSVFLLLTPPMTMIFALRTCHFEKNRMFGRIDIQREDFLYKDIMKQFIRVKNQWRIVEKRVKEDLLNCINFCKVQNNYMMNMATTDLMDYSLNSCIKVREYFESMEQTLSEITELENLSEELKEMLLHNYERVEEKLARCKHQYDDITINQMKSPSFLDLSKETGLVNLIDEIREKSSEKIREYFKFEKQATRARENLRTIEDCKDRLRHAVTLLESLLDGCKRILANQESLRDMITIFSFFKEISEIQYLLCEKWRELQQELTKIVNQVCGYSLEISKLKSEEDVDHIHYSSLLP